MLSRDWGVPISDTLAMDVRLSDAIERMLGAQAEGDERARARMQREKDALNR